MRNQLFPSYITAIDEYHVYKRGFAHFRRSPVNANTTLSEVRRNSTQFPLRTSAESRSTPNCLLSNSIKEITLRRERSSSSNNGEKIFLSYSRLSDQPMVTSWPPRLLCIGRFRTAKLILDSSENCQPHLRSRLNRRRTVELVNIIASSDESVQYTLIQLPLMVSQRWTNTGVSWGSEHKLRNDSCHSM